MKKIIVNVYDIAAWLYADLVKNGIQFNSEGYPIFKTEFILWDKPEYIIPVNHRNSSPDKSKTALCYFINDEYLYKRLANLRNDIHLLYGYMGICGFDLSPRLDWDEDLQKFHILLSQMVTIWIALHGIKIIPNFRIGILNTISALNSYPSKTPFAVGFLGNNRRKYSESECAYFTAKLLYSSPVHLALYGKTQNVDKEILDELNIDYSSYLDFRSFCRNRRIA